VVYEARPNVTVDVAALCLKSGNAAVLRGSSVAAHTNGAIADLIAEVLQGQDEVPAQAVQLIRDNSRDAVIELLTADEYVDLLVPRGGPSLLQTVREHATVPVVIDGDGNCHVYVDASADPAMATNIVVNAKTSRPSVCNAAETLLVHEEIAPNWLPGALDELHKLGVVVRGDDQVRAIWPDAEPAQDSDWAAEYLDLILAVRVVPGLDPALAHIARWGTRNSEAIVAQDIAVARRFARAVDSGSVFVNCSTRFSDGGEFGYGLEIGVSTQKLHARGPMGLEALTCVKNVTWGTGQIRV
jgi:glutamate-5-semialdehyde dehydrogenase